MNNGFFNLVSNFLSPSPKEVRGLDNTSYLYYEKQLWLKLYSIFNFENMPITVNVDYLKDNLFQNGNLGIVSYNGNVYILVCGVEKNNAYNFPLEINIANHVLGSFKREIGKDAELLYFNYVRGSFNSVYPLIKRYALLLAQCDGTLNTSMMNSRVSAVFWGSTDAEVKSLKKMYDEVSTGKPAVFLKKDNGVSDNISVDILNAKNTFIGKEVLDCKRTIMNEFLTEIGINNANTSKRERLNSDEVNANNEECNALINLWCDTMNKCFEKANRIFKTNMKVSLNEKVITRLQKEMTGSELE